VVTDVPEASHATSSRQLITVAVNPFRTHAALEGLAQRTSHQSPPAVPRQTSACIAAGSSRMTTSRPGAILPCILAVKIGPRPNSAADHRPADPVARRPASVRVAVATPDRGRLADHAACQRWARLLAPTGVLAVVLSPDRRPDEPTLVVAAAVGAGLTYLQRFAPLFVVSTPPAVPACAGRPLVHPRELPEGRRPVALPVSGGRPVRQVIDVLLTPGHRRGQAVPHPGAAARAGARGGDHRPRSGLSPGAR
jgi:hypothetical protein